jgi:TolB-like protein/Flp pilus assembly protein TadD
VGADSPESANTPAGAVFLSYASQDAEAAGRICAALRAAGIEVWFDQSELRGGDAWDQLIRRQIKSCALFVPVVSKNTHARAEGYFRLEWKLAVDRSHLIMANRAFLLPVVIDDTADDDQHVPEKFHEVQWTRLPSGTTPPEFVTRVQKLLAGQAALSPRRTPAAQPVTSAYVRPGWLAAGLALAAGVAYLLFEHPWSTRVAASAPPAPAINVASAFAPPPHSIAVLPFVNMSGDASQEYFSDGLTEELLNSLARFPQLQVAARTSAFSFKGKEADVATIARKLNVGAVLEGSVRRSAQTLRVTTQLIDAVTGFDLWSQTYDRNLGDVLKLQTDIATSVANALKVTLLSDTAETVGLGATRDPAALDAYLRARILSRSAQSAENSQAILVAYTEAIRIDPRYAQAFAERGVEYAGIARMYARGPALRDALDKSLADARTAVKLAPDLAESHFALGVSHLELLDFPTANQEFERALTLGPGNARIVGGYARNAAEMGIVDGAINAARRAVTLDPLNPSVYRIVGIGMMALRRYDDAAAAFQSALALQPGNERLNALLGTTQYFQGKPAVARASCEIAAADDLAKLCLAFVYHKLGRSAQAETLMRQIQSAGGDEGALDYAYVCAQWGEVDQALRWLETAFSLRDPNLFEIRTAPELDPIRREPRFQAILRALNFPH